MISADFDLNLGGFYEKLSSAASAVANLKLPTLSLMLGGAGDAKGAIGSMQAALAQANAAATPLNATLLRLEAGMQGLSAVARTASVALAVFPKTFAGIHPAVTKSLSAVSLAGRGFDVLRGKMSPVGAAIAYVELKNLGLSKSYAALGATAALAASGVVKSARSMATAVQSASAGVSGIGRSGMAGISGLLGPLAAMTGAVGVGGLAFMGLKKSISEAADMESLRIAFATLIGSSSKAREVLADLSKFAAETPFDMPQVGDAARKLLAFGVGADDLKNELRSVGDIASGVQAPIAEIAEIYGKAKVQGRLFAEDINQLTGRGIPVIGELAKQFGVTEDAVKGLVENGKVGFADIQTAFQNMTSKGGRFFNMMLMQSGTWNGLMATLGDSVNAVFREFGTPLLDTFKPMLAKAIEMADYLAAKAKEFGQQVANAIQGLYGAFKTGDLMKVLGLGLEIAVKSAINLLNQGFQGVSAMAAEALSAAAEVFQQTLGESSFWEGVGKKMEAVFLRLKATLMDAFASLVDVLPESLGGGKGVGDSLRRSGEAAEAWAKVRDMQGDKAFAEVDLPGIIQGAFEALKGSMSAFQKAADGAVPVYGDVAEKMAELQSALAAGRIAAGDIFKPAADIETGAGAANSPASVAGGASKLISSALASVGLGGFTGGSGNAALSEARKQTKELSGLRQDIRNLIAGKGTTITVIPKFA